MNRITNLKSRSTLFCLCTILMLGCSLSASAFNDSPAYAEPNCTLITATGATATSGNAALAKDGNGATRWESAFTDDQSITLDLGATVSINSVSIDWEAANAKDYTLQGSTDNVNWTVIATKNNMPGGTRTDVIAGINASYRYVKMQGISRNLTYGYSIWEFYVCSTAIIAPDCADATGVTATASSGNAALAVDDIAGTRWESASSDPQSLTVDLGAAALVREIRIKWETANAKNYTLSGSLDGIEWVVIQTLTNMPTGNRTDFFDGVDTVYRYLKMDGTARNTIWGYSIFEFDVCTALPETVGPFECDGTVDENTATATSGTAAAAIDGNLNTRWESAASNVQSLTVDMGETVTVEFVKIDWETANAKNYTLSGSVNGTDWELIAARSNMAVYGNHRIDYLVVNGEYRYLMMTGTARNTPYGYSIHEFEICGERPTAYTLIPARIEAEDWYAMHGVQTETCADTGGGLDVSYIDDNDWMDYPIEVTTAGEYIIDARISSISATGIIDYSIDGSSLGTIAVPNTGSWQLWQTVHKGIYLTAGQHKLRVKAAAEQYNLNWIEIKEPCFNWAGTTSNNWATGSNWCGGAVPTANSDVVITAGSNNPVISAGTVYAGSLTLQAGATLTVATGATLWVANAVDVNASATLTVQDNGALVQAGNAQNTGNIVFHKKSNPLYRLDYTLWSAPVTGQTLRQFSMNTSNNRFYVYAYDTADGGTTYNEAYWPVEPITTYFEPAKAYLIRMPNSNDAAGYNTGDNPIIFDGTFNGVPNNGNYTQELSQEGNRYTAVGNPYPSPIGVYDFLMANSNKLAQDTGIWLWRKRNSSSNASYLTLNLSGLVVSPGNSNGNGDLDDELAGYYQGSNTSWVIAPGQGFLVQAAEGLAQPEINFTNTMRRATPGAQAFFKSAAGAASRYWINIMAQGGTGSQALVAYNSQATAGIDYGYDSKVFSSGIALYSLAGTTKLAIQARPEFEVNDVVPMGFTAPAAGQYTISLDHAEGVFAQGQDIYLKDLQEGIIRNLGTTDYTFTTEAGTFEGRFEVVYQTAALGTESPQLNANVLVYRNDSGISISASDTITSVMVYDLLGRNIFASNNINTNSFSTGALSVSNQAVIVKVTLANGCETTKKIIF